MGRRATGRAERPTPAAARHVARFAAARVADRCRVADGLEPGRGGVRGRAHDIGLLGAAAHGRSRGALPEPQLPALRGRAGVPAAESPSRARTADVPRARTGPPVPVLLERNAAPRTA